jgi:hypothetical protein
MEQTKKDLEFIRLATKANAERSKLQGRLIREGKSEILAHAVATLWHAVHSPKHNKFDNKVLISVDEAKVLLDKLKRKL